MGIRTSLTKDIMALTQLQKNVINRFLQENVNIRENQQGGAGWAWLTDFVIKTKAQQLVILRAWLDAKKLELQDIDTEQNKVEHEARIAEEIALIDATNAGL